MVYNPRGGQNVHVDTVLTNISVGYPNNEFVGERLFPSIPVAKQSNKFYIFGRESWGVEPGGDWRAPAAVANEIPGLQVSVDSYFAKEHSLMIPVADEEYENSDSPLQPRIDATNLVTQKVLLGREITMQALVTTAANYASGNSVTLSGTSQWSDYTNSHPILAIKAGKYAMHAKLFVEPNTAVIPYQVMMQLEDHPDFIQRIQYSERGIITPDIIASVIGIPNVIVPGVGFNTANPGQTASLGYLWGKDVILAYVPERPGLKIPAFGYEFNWRWPETGGPMLVDGWRVDPRKADMIRAGRRYDLKLPAQDAAGKAIGGYLIKAAVA